MNSHNEVNSNSNNNNSTHKKENFSIPTLNMWNNLPADLWNLVLDNLPTQTITFFKSVSKTSQANAKYYFKNFERFLTLEKLLTCIRGSQSIADAIRFIDFFRGTKLYKTLETKFATNREEMSPLELICYVYFINDVNILKQDESIFISCVRNITILNEKNSDLIDEGMRGNIFTQLFAVVGALKNDGSIEEDTLEEYKFEKFTSKTPKNANAYAPVRCRDKRKYFNLRGYTPTNQDDLYGCYFDNADLRNANFGNLTVYSRYFENTNFENANFSNARFVNCVFDGANLINVQLENASFLTQFDLVRPLRLKFKENTQFVLKEAFQDPDALVNAITKINGNERCLRIQSHPQELILRSAIIQSIFYTIDSLNPKTAKSLLEAVYPYFEPRSNFSGKHTYNQIKFLN